MKKYVATVLLAMMSAFLLIGCGNQSEGASEGEGAGKEGEYRSDVPTADLKKAVVDALGEAYWPESEMPAEYLSQMLGVSTEWYEEYLGEMPMMSTKVDTLVIVKAEEDNVAQVEEALGNYRKMLMDDLMQYPMNLGKIQASRLETFGNYVCFVQLGGDTVSVMDENPGDEDNAVIAYCQQQNDMALEAIKQALSNG